LFAFIFVVAAIRKEKRVVFLFFFRIVTTTKIKTKIFSFDFWSLADATKATEA
jgi:hypothetical protein